MQTPKPAHGRFAILCLLLWCSLCVLPAALVWLVDPLQIFHRSWLPTAFFYKDNERYQIPGLINQYLDHTAAGEKPFDSLIIGTSVSTNISHDELQQTLGWHALNLSMRLASITERHFVMQRALQNTQVKHVLMELYMVDVDDVEPVEQKPHYPLYLYSDNLLDKRHYLFNNDSLTMAMSLLIHQGLLPTALSHYWPFNPAAWHNELGTWNAWMQEPGRLDAFNRFRDPAYLQDQQARLEALCRVQDREHWRWREDYSFAEQARYVNDIILAHPDVEFYVWFSASSLGRYAFAESMETLDKSVEYRRFIVNTLAGLPNVKIFGFDNEAAITGNLLNYMDYSHFSPEVQRWILQEMAQDRFRLQPEMIDAYARQLKDNLLQFNVQQAGAWPTPFQPPVNNK